MNSLPDDPGGTVARDVVRREEFVLQAEAVLAMAVVLADRGSVPTEAAQAVAQARLVLAAFTD